MDDANVGGVCLFTEVAITMYGSQGFRLSFFHRVEGGVKRLHCLWCAHFQPTLVSVYGFGRFVKTCKTCLTRQLWVNRNEHGDCRQRRLLQLSLKLQSLKDLLNATESSLNS